MCLKNIFKRKSKMLAPLTIPEQYNIVNFSSYPLATNIIVLGLQELSINKINIEIHNMEQSHINNFDNNGFDLKAYIIPKSGYYKVGISKNISDSYLVTTLSHELIHLKQFYDNRLVIIDKNNVIWEGKQLKIYPENYESREWEIEAFINQGKISKKIQDKLWI